MGRHRCYHLDRPATEAERKAASRHKQALERLSQIPVVHGEHYTVYQGDALTTLPLLQAFDHCITDPPYEAETHSAMRRTLVRKEARMASPPLAFAPLTERQRRWIPPPAGAVAPHLLPDRGGRPLPAAPRGEVQADARVAQAGRRPPVYGR